MTREELLERLVRRALVRYGVRVTDTIFGDWLREKLIFTPPKTGRRRHWTARHYRIALEICRLRSQGIDFAGILRWHLWIKGFNRPTFDPTKQRRALFKEFRRLRKEAVVLVNSSYDPRTSTQLSPWKSQMLMSSIGTQDERLTPILPIVGADIIGSWGLSKFDHRASGIEKAAESFMEQQLRSLDTGLPEEELKALASQAAEKAVSILGGVLGEMDELEFSGETTILTANRASFELARNLTANMRGMLARNAEADPANFEGYEAVARSATTPQWRIINFVNFLHAVHRGGLEGGPVTA